MSERPQHPLVSVIIPTWNAAVYLPRTLESVLDQTWPNIEIVIVDDGSTDGTQDLLNRFDDRITSIRIENSGGPSRPRNKGIEAAHGAFIAFFDSDDLMEPDKIACSMEVFTRHAEVGLVFTNFRSIDQSGRMLTEDYLAEYRQFRRDLQPNASADTGLMGGERVFRNLIRANFIGTSSVVCRREIFEEVGPFCETMKNSDDLDMWMRIARTGHTFAFIDRVLHSYRVTPGGVTARGAARIPAMIQGLQNQLPHCTHPEDRRYIHNKIRRLHLDRAWKLRQNHQYEDAMRSYRQGLKMRWGLKPFLGLLKARWLALIRTDRSVQP